MTAAGEMGKSRFAAYIHTMRYLRASQIWHRIMRRAGGTTPLSRQFAYARGGNTQYDWTPIPELDFDSAFLARFSPDGLLNNRISLLHTARDFRWDEKWLAPECSALWNYNLHYCEFLLPLLARFRETGEAKYSDAAKKIIQSWIKENPVGARGFGWDSYTLSLRLTNWLECYAYLEAQKCVDPVFRDLFLASVEEQYAHLYFHLEKDLLGNHLLENLKALILCALFLKDDVTLDKAVAAWRAECREQILSDGMHFELSPMYHKIVLEDVIRVAYALRAAGRPDRETEKLIGPMLNAAYSFEHGLSRIPLFNDCGDNVAKSLNALEAAALRFGIVPRSLERLEAAGYFFFSNGPWRLIVDAGKPGPEYIPGHSHCDAMSFELFYHGEPVLVNCGTYAYQCDERSFYRSTAAHNTLQARDNEQSEIWSAFRLGRRIELQSVDAGENRIRMRICDYRGHVLARELRWDESALTVTDEGECAIRSYIHFAPQAYDKMRPGLSVDAETIEEQAMPYAPEYGCQTECRCVVAESGIGKIRWTFILNMRNGGD